MKNIMEKLGLEKVKVLNVSICKKRVRHIKRELKAGTYGSENTKLYQYAIYYINWYTWMANNGGTRSKKVA